LSVDLSEALRKWITPAAVPDQPWRIHFHVPIYVDQFGELSTTRSDIADACRYLEAHRRDSVAGAEWFTGHYEVETYAWPVLPADLQVSSLSAGIAQELEYFETVLRGQQAATP